MRVRTRLCAALLGLAAACAASSALAETSCRIAFDIGSSGVRAGASSVDRVVRSDYDYLGHAPADWDKPTAAALRELPVRAGFPSGCAEVGGGFSAWRRAADTDRASLLDVMRRIHAATGVAVLVLPQDREAAYGHAGARVLLGARLQTSHVLDIGGGSLQVADAATGQGLPLGQKLWHGALCQALRATAATPCALAPLSDSELAHARALLADRLRPLRAALPEAATLTAVSRPVTRGILPALRRLELLGTEATEIGFAALDSAITRLAALDLSAIAAATGAAPAHAAFLLSDLLLVEGVMHAAGSPALSVAEVDLTNVPGLLADERAYAWTSRYACYLDLFSRHGTAAYAADPASCP